MTAAVSAPGPTASTTATLRWRRRLGVGLTAALGAFLGGLGAGLVPAGGGQPQASGSFAAGSLATGAPHLAASIAPGGIPGASASGLGPIAVVGDSNSVAPWFTPGWVEMTERLLGYEPGDVVNTSIPGAMAGIHPDEPDTKSGPGILDDALAAGVPLDGVLLALGTNDILVGRGANEILGTLEQLEAQVEAFDEALPVFVALVAPITYPVEDALLFQAEVDQLNGLILANFPPERVIDFAAPLADGPLGTEYTLYNDGVHHNALANGLKAAAAVDVLIVYFGLVGTGD